MQHKQPGLRVTCQWQEQKLQLKGAFSDFILWMSSWQSRVGVEMSVQVVILQLEDETCALLCATVHCCALLSFPRYVSFSARLCFFTGSMNTLCFVN